MCHNEKAALASFVDLLWNNAGRFSKPGLIGSAEDSVITLDLYCSRMQSLAGLCPYTLNTE